MRWEKSGEIQTDGGHRVYFSGKEDKHEQGVHKDIVKSVMGCRPVSSRLMTVRLRASPFNVTRYMNQHPAMMTVKLMSSTGNSSLLLIKHQSRTFWLYKVIGTQKLEKMHKKIGEKFSGTFCNPEPKDRGLKLLNFATYNKFELANTLGNH